MSPLRTTLAPHLALWTTLASALAACDGTSAVPPIDAIGDSANIPPELTKVETTVLPAAIGAGESATVTCTGKDQYDAPFEPPAPFAFDVLDANDRVPEGVTVEGSRITAQYAGVIRVRCRYTGTPPLEDGSPVSLVVQSGVPASVKTGVLKTELVAGDKIGVACSVRDAQNNATSAPTVLRVSPETGTTVTEGKTIRFEKVGTFEVTCALEDGSLVGNTITITVEPAALAELDTVLSKDIITPDEQVNVTCPGHDEFGNAVDLDLVITLPVDGVTALDTNRLRLTATRAGVYPITCVPKESWVSAKTSPASLAVVPGPGASMSLDLAPDRTVYTLGARPIATPRIADAYGNAIADTSSVDIEVRHGGQVQQTIASGERATLDKEGTWTLTARTGAPWNLTATRTVIVDASAPTIDITYPARGQMVVTNGTSLTLRGEIKDASGGLASVTVNGVPRPVTQGQNTLALEMPLSITHGLNTLTVVATDVQGQSTRIVQSFIAGPAYMASTQAFSDGVIAHLARNFIDDGNHTGAPNDLSTIFERVIYVLDLGDFIPSPVVTYAGFDVFLQDINYARPKVALAPARDELLVDLDIDDLDIDVFADGFIDVSGTVTASSVKVDMQLGVTVVQGQPKVTAKAIVVTIEDLDIAVHWSINWLIDLFTNTIRDSIISSFESTLRKEVPKAVEEALAGFALDESFEVPAFFPGMSPLNVKLQGTPDHTTLNESALDLALGTKVTAATKVPWPTMGSILRGGCFGVDGGMPAWNPGKKLTIALSTDLLNQILHAVWKGGALELSLGASAFGDADLSQYGVSDLEVDVSARLPPLLTDCVGGVLRIQLGELQLDASLKLGGMPLDVGMIVAFQTTADITLDPEGKLVIGLGAIANEDIIIDITRIESELFGPDQEEALIELLRDQLLSKLLEGFAGGGLADLPLPELDLGGISPALAGQVISLRNATLARGKGYLLLEGDP